MFSSVPLRMCSVIGCFLDASRNATGCCYSAVLVCQHCAMVGCTQHCAMVGYTKHCTVVVYTQNCAVVGCTQHYAVVVYNIHSAYEVNLVENVCFVFCQVDPSYKYSCINMACHKKNMRDFKCYSSEKLITLNTLHEVVPTWYSFSQLSRLKQCG